MNKRFILFAAVIFSFAARAQQLPALTSGKIVENIKNATAVAVLSNGQPATSIKIVKKWQGNSCVTTITNTSKKPVNLKEVVLFKAAKQFAPTTPIYAEGFQLLSQTGGTLEKPADLGYYTDRSHYKLAEEQGYRTVYNVLQLMPANSDQVLMGYASSNRFVGKFLLSGDTVKVVEDLENIAIPAGATWKLEDFFIESHNDRNRLYDDLSSAIGKNHPRLKIAEPTGWCSWICFGPGVTSKNVSDNLKAIKANVPSLRYIQIDDGYQANMGDWTTIGKSFGGGIVDVLKQIKHEGFEPAIWVAPFICDTNSSIYKQHKDWLLKDDNNRPLRSDKVGFGGWRLGPWYVLDGTNPAVQKHFEELFRTMNKDWGVTYFKLDANYWATIPHARYYRKNATRTEAYREGMKAILKGAGANSFILGCNEPMWPSLGVVHGNRTSMDIAPDFESFKRVGSENLYRSWQNNKLWWNDPDCILLTQSHSKQTITDNQYMFHAALIYATGGMLLSGDDIGSIPANRMKILRSVAVPTGTAARWNANTFDYGWIIQPKSKKLVILNWGKTPKTFTIPVDGPCKLKDFFTGQEVGTFDKRIELKDIPGEFGNVYVVED